MSQNLIKCKHMHGDICTTHHLSCQWWFVPIHPIHRSDAASVHWQHSILTGRITASLFLKLWSVRSKLLGIIYLTKLAQMSPIPEGWNAQSAGALSCWKIMNSTDISRAWQATDAKSEARHCSDKFKIGGKYSQGFVAGLPLCTTVKQCRKSAN